MMTFDPMSCRKTGEIAENARNGPKNAAEPETEVNLRDGPQVQTGGDDLECRKVDIFR